MLAKTLEEGLWRWGDVRLREAVAAAAAGARGDEGSMLGSEGAEASKGLGAGADSNAARMSDALRKTAGDVSLRNGYRLSGVRLEQSGLWTPDLSALDHAHVRRAAQDCRRCEFAEHESHSWCQIERRLQEDGRAAGR